MKKFLLSFVLLCVILTIYAVNISEYNKSQATTNKNLKNFWSKPYNITNLDILNQRIENLKNENFRYESLNAEKYFYDCAIIKDSGEYILRFTVWKKDKTCTESDIIYGINEIIVKDVLLKENSFRENIKVLIELFGGNEGDNLEKVLFNDYVK